MAKLTNVKTLDMVNGEITRIEYDGAVYGRVADGASIQDGDIGLRVNSPADWADIGSYYPIVNNGRSYKDNNGYPKLMVKRHFVYFRKINAEKTPELNDRVYFKPGDEVIAVNVNWIDAGTIGKVIEDDGSNSMPLLVRFEGEHDDLWVDLDEIKPLKQAQSASPKTEKRRAKVGERILITNADYAGDPPKYKNGDILTVESVGVEGEGTISAVEVKKLSGPFIYDTEYEVIIEETAPPQYRKVTGREPRVGDYVKYNEDPEPYLTAGKYYEIKGIDSNGDPQIIDDDGEKYDTFFDDYEVYELVETEASPEQPQLKVGDYAKVVGVEHTIETRGPHSFEIGEIVKLKSRFKIEPEKGFRCERLNGYPTAGPSVAIEDLAPATDDEVEAAKWAAIGRKPNEYKKGDVVRVVDTLSAVFLYEGQLTEVINPKEEGGQVVRSNDGGTQYAKVELVTPVEARFDRID